MHRRIEVVVKTLEHAHEIDSTPTTARPSRSTTTPSQALGHGALNSFDAGRIVVASIDRVSALLL
jgi:hypothetical protein